MASVNQTRTHCVNQMVKTHSKPLAARHGRGTACCVWIGLYMPITFSAPRKSETTNEVEPSPPPHPLKGGEVVPRWSTERSEAWQHTKRNVADYYHIVSRIYALIVKGTYFRHPLHCDHKMQNHAVTQPFCSPVDVSLSVLLPTQLNNSKTQIRQFHQPSSTGTWV